MRNTKVTISLPTKLQEYVASGDLPLSEAVRHALITYYRLNPHTTAPWIDAENTVIGNTEPATKPLPQPAAPCDDSSAAPQAQPAVKVEDADMAAAFAALDLEIAKDEAEDKRLARPAAPATQRKLIAIFHPPGGASAVDVFEGDAHPWDAYYPGYIVSWLEDGVQHYEYDERAEAEDDGHE